MVASADPITLLLFLASSVATIAHRFIGLPRVSALPVLAKPNVGRCDTKCPARLTKPTLMQHQRPHPPSHILSQFYLIKVYTRISHKSQVHRGSD